MQQLDASQLATVFGGESLGQVLSAARTTVSNAPLDQTYAATTAFIRDHEFFHQGLMNAPIGFGKHFRNVPFVGPAQILQGNVRKGVEITRATWNAA